MAEEEKNLPASERRINKAREEGRVATSRELSAALSLGAGMLALFYLLPALGAGIWELFTYTRTQMLSNELVATDLLWAAGIALATVGVPLVAILASADAVAIAAGLVSTRFNFAPEVLTPKLEKLDVFKNAQQTFFSATPWVQLLKGSLISLLLLWAIWTTVEDRMGTIMVLSSRPMSGQIAFIQEIAAAVLQRAIPVAIAIGILDFVYQTWKLDQDLMMSTQEMKEEYKEAEGDPQIRAKRKQRQRQLSVRQSLAKVATADVIVTNPTHYAVALRYRRNENAAPVVVARGLDHLALQIRQEASRHDIMIVENRPLARALYAHAKVDAAIPAEFYAPVAEVLAVVYKKRRRRAG